MAKVSKKAKRAKAKTGKKTGKKKGGRPRGSTDKRPRRRRQDNPAKNLDGKRNKKGRPRGGRDALPKGAVSAIRVCRYRIPDDIPDVLAGEASMALEVVSKVMRGQIKAQTMARLSAARTMREEVCGKLVQTVDVPGLTDLGKAIIEARARKAKKEGDGE